MTLSSSPMPRFEASDAEIPWQRRNRLPSSVSVVVPCYNEEAVVATLCERLTQTVGALDVPYELVLVDDCSRDRTWELLQGLRKHYPALKVVRLARNGGQQVALTCGLDQAAGEVVIVMDADLQDPPELIPEMLRRWQSGYDVVYGKRMKREGETISKRFFAFSFYRLFSAWTGFNLPRDTGDFRLMDRRVVDALRSLRERHRFLRGMVTWIGFYQTPLEYVRPQRVAGESKYPFQKSFRLACDALVSFSLAPLRGFFYLGAGLLVVALAAAVAVAAHWYESGVLSLAGIIVTCVTLFLAVQSLLFGVLAEYVGKIFELCQRRPLYIVEAAHGDPLAAAAGNSAGEVFPLDRRMARL